MPSNKKYYEVIESNESPTFAKAFNVSVLSEDEESNLEMVPLGSLLAIEENHFELANSNSKSNLLAQDSSVQKALAEISFIEANETVEKGDLQSAIAKYKEAINYFSDNSEYYLRFIDILRTDVKYKTELNSLIKTTTTKFPTDQKVEEKIKELQTLALSTLKPTKTTKNIKTFDKVLDLREVQDIVLTKNSKALTKKLKPSLISENNDKTKSDKMVRLRNNVYVLTEGVKKQNPYIKAITVLILILLPIGVFWGLTKSYKETIVETIPISPEPQSKLAENQLYFCWNSSTDKVDYLFQIEQEGKSVLERYTREKFYLVSQEDAQVIKKNTYSTWRVIPISPKRETLKYKISEAQFMITK